MPDTENFYDDLIIINLYQWSCIFRSIARFEQETDRSYYIYLSESIEPYKKLGL